MIASEEKLDREEVRQPLKPIVDVRRLHLFFVVAKSANVERSPYRCRMIELDVTSWSHDRVHTLVGSRHRRHKRFIAQLAGRAEKSAELEMAVEVRGEVLIGKTFILGPYSRSGCVA